MRFDFFSANLGRSGYRRYLSLWLIFFLATAFAAFAIQLVILPYIFPHLHAGHGLLVGGDWVGFHQLATDIAARIRSEGWSVWTLRPRDNAPTGIAAAIYALTTVSEPYMLVPLNAALHATAGVTLLVLMEKVLEGRDGALFATLPLLLFPSAAAWYSQIHKDGFFIAGMLLCLTAWVMCFERRGWTLRRSVVLLSIMLSGACLVWMVRPYMVVLLQLIGTLMALLGTIVFTRLVLRHELRVRYALMALMVLVVCPIMMAPLKDTTWVGASVGSTVKADMPDIKTRSNAEIDAARQASGYGFGEQAWQRWQRTSWLPKRVDNAFFSLTHARDGLLSESYRDAKSTIDPDFKPSNAVEFISYLPRALFVGVLAPFPSHWMADGRIESSTMMRRIVSVEMMTIYVAVLLLPFSIAALRKKLAFWVSLGFSVAFLILYAYVTPNLGTLHRMRYVFITTLVALSFGGALKYFRRKTLASPRPLATVTFNH